jgi:small basic protein
MGKSIWVLVPGILIFAIWFVFIGDFSFTQDKISGLLLALVAFLPVFITLNRSLGKKSPEWLYGAFVMGFFFKVLVLLGGIWLGVKKFGLEINGFAISCVGLIIILQIFESIYFWGKRG